MIEAEAVAFTTQIVYSIKTYNFIPTVGGSGLYINSETEVTILPPGARLAKFCKIFSMAPFSQMNTDTWN